MDGAARVAEQRPRLLFSLAAVIGLVFYLIAVPYQNWIGLFPRGDHVEMIAGWPRAAAGAQTQLLNGVQANFTRIWRSHANSPPPPALYAAPALTPEQKARYRHLRRPPTPAKAIARKQASSAKYMFVAALKDVGDQLPDLVNALAVVTAFLGPDRVSFSIIEGPSWDPTPHVLKDVVRPMLNSLGVHDSSINFEVNLPSISWDKVNRIEALAELRNQALQPLWGHGSDPAWDVAAIVYFNDVFLHAADMLELLHQHVTSSRGLGTGITAAWDWMTRDPAHFYDVWVARTVSVWVRR
jgi:alpha-1,3-mannosyltransferase